MTGKNWMVTYDRDPVQDHGEEGTFEELAAEVQQANLVADSPTEALRRLKVGDTLHLPQYKRTSQVSGITSPMKRTDGMRFTTRRDGMLDCVAVTRIS